VFRANAVGSCQIQPEVLMNLKLKDPMNQNSSFQFEKNEAAAEKGGGINLEPLAVKKGSGMLIHFFLAICVNNM